MKNKHILSALLAVLAVLSLAFTLAMSAVAAPEATLTGPDSINAGEEITLSYTATEGVLGFSATLQYDHAQLELLDITSSPGVIIELDNIETGIGAGFSGELFTQLLTFKFKVKADIAPQTAVSVTLTNVTLTTVDYDEPAFPDLTWTGTVATPKSSDNTLKSLAVEGYPIDFSPSTLKYYITVPTEVTRVNITAQVNDPAARMEIKNVSPLVAGESNRIRVVVTAENGAEQTYNIYVTREAPETEPPKSNDNTLKSLAIEGVTIPFASDKTQYTIEVESNVESLVITATPSDSDAMVEIKNNVLTAGASTTVRIVVTAEDGSTRTYSLHVTRKAAQTTPPDTDPPVVTDPPVTNPPDTDPPVTTTPPDTDPSQSTGGAETSGPADETKDPTPPVTADPGDDDRPGDQTIFWLNAIYIIILVGCLLVIAILIVLLILYRRMNNNLRQQ